MKSKKKRLGRMQQFKSSPKYKKVKKKNEAQKNGLLMCSSHSWGCEVMLAVLLLWFLFLLCMSLSICQQLLKKRTYQGPKMQMCLEPLVLPFSSLLPSLSPL